MTFKLITEITCDKCGRDIDKDAPFWRASVANPTAFPGYNPLSNQNGPYDLAICLECVQPVLGELIRKARSGQGHPHEIAPGIRRHPGSTVPPLDTPEGDTQ